MIGRSHPPAQGRRYSRSYNKPVATKNITLNLEKL
jgi:hypothetical protein